MNVLEIDKLRIEINLLRQIINKSSIDKNSLEDYLADKELMYERLNKIYQKVNPDQDLADSLL